MIMQNKHPLGIFLVCDAELSARLSAAKKLGIPTAQILAPPAEQRDQKGVEILLKQFKEAGLTITVVFCGFNGESYADIPTVQATVGLVPGQTRASRLQEAKMISDFAAQLGVEVTALHIGFVPHDPQGADYQAMVKVAQELCDHCAKNKQRLHLETGQETAEALLAFIKDVNRSNLAVNFDPANMVLYGCGEPLPALRLLGPYVKSVHCKDAKWAVKPGQEWGQEMPLGQGDVDMAKFLQTLKEIGYAGPLTIEREIAGAQQLLDIQKAVELLQTLTRTVWP
jgi:sugar phosphate isomerase/epimerase